MAVVLDHRISGPPADTALLLVHPLGADKSVWDDCMAFWSKRRRVVAADLRGAGGSPVPDRPRRVDEHAEDLEALRRTLGLRKVVPIGCAIGAFVAAAYAAKHSEHVAGLVLSDPAARLGADSRERTEARVKLIRQGGMRALIPEAIDLAFEKMPRDERYDLYTELFARNDPLGYERLALGMAGSDLSDAMSALTMPTLVLVGRHDRLFPPERAEEVHRLVRGSEYRVIEEAAHFPPYQAPARFGELVSDFLDRRVPT